VASENSVDATIMQGNLNYTWSNFRFSQFSDWVSIFHGGSGTITIKQHSTGTVLLKTSLPLTPGPLVVVIKCATAQVAVAAAALPPSFAQELRVSN
jgi:hypothetical protein